MSLRIPKWLLDIADKIYLQPTPMFISWNPQFHKLKGKEILNILDIMQPGDILLRRHGGYLNSLAIPGYWTHASIVYDKDTIAHAVGKGTCYENIFDWFRADGCALLRPNQTYDIDNILEKVETIVGVDYQYDYEFKADNGMIYCTEFIDLIVIPASKSRVEDSQTYF